MADFFISYTGTDRDFAVWIAWTLEAEGHSTIVQAWDFRPGSNFALEMQGAAATATRTIAVFSPEYLASRYGAAEWAAAFAGDPEGVKRKLVPVRVRECPAEGLLKAVVHIDLVGCAEDEARRRLLDGIKEGRAKPAAKPHFPGPPNPSSGRPAPTFPGVAATQVLPRSASGYKPKIGRAITDLDRRRFFKAAFDTVRQRFEAELAELERESSDVQTDITLVDSTKFTAEVFVKGDSRGRCKIWQGGLSGSDGISYAEGNTMLSDNALNDTLVLADSRDELALNALMNMGLGNAGKGLNTSKMTLADAAEYLWRRFCWTFEH